MAKQEGNQKRFCCNCGQEGHMLKDCTRAVNHSAIDARKKAFNELKEKARKSKQDGKKEDDKKESPKSGKWAPPLPTKKKKRVINVKPSFGTS
jgi:Zinc knuckle